jgi:hypothetical protein
MVGGFSDSPLLYKRVKSEFPKLNVICPSDAVAAVLKGAVIVRADVFRTRQY